VWATVSVRRDGAIVQVDRGGHPTINPFVNPNNIKNEYCRPRIPTAEASPTTCSAPASPG
jgi:hypothetical protein